MRDQSDAALRKRFNCHGRKIDCATKRMFSRNMSRAGPSDLLGRGAIVPSDLWRFRKLVPNCPNLSRLHWRESAEWSWKPHPMCNGSFGSQPSSRLDVQRPNLPKWDKSYLTKHIRIESGSNKCLHIWKPSRSFPDELLVAATLAPASDFGKNRSKTLYYH